MIGQQISVKSNLRLFAFDCSDFCIKIEVFIICGCKSVLNRFKISRVF